MEEEDLFDVPENFVVVLYVVAGVAGVAVAVFGTIHHQFPNDH